MPILISRKTGGNDAACQAALAECEAGGPTPPVAGYDLWLNSSDPLRSLLVDPSSRVASWRDKSGSGHHGLSDIAATTTRPTYTARTINGITAVEFVGASIQRLDTTCPNSSRTTTVFVVALIDSVSGSPTLFASTSGDGGNQFAIADVAGVGRLITNKEFIAELGRNTSAAVPVGSAFLAVQRLTATTVEMIIDGVSEVDADATAFTAGRVRRVGTMFNGGQPFDGLIAELISYPTTLSDANLALVTTYLRDKWGTA